MPTEWTSPTWQSFGRRICQLAEKHPSEQAIVLLCRGGDERSLTWSQLATASSRAAAFLLCRGVDERSSVAVVLGNSLEHFGWAIGAWMLGACVIPVNPASPPAEADRLLDLIEPAAVIAGEGAASPPDTIEASSLFDLPEAPVQFTDVAACPSRAIASGGSTGDPKLILDPSPWGAVPEHPRRTLGGGVLGDVTRAIGLRPRQRQLIATPVYHTSGFTWAHLGLFDDHTLFVMERFDANVCLDAFERHGIEFAVLVPAMMQRLLETGEATPRHFRTLRTLLHSGASCPAAIKRDWLELVDPKRVVETYGSTEAIGAAMTRGDAWMKRPDSVGKPIGCATRILAEDGAPRGPGQVGEIFMRPHRRGPAYAYVGAAPGPITADGFSSVGDLGCLDDEGYLYIADRRADMIISGGINIFTAEVERALVEHPGVRDVLVVGVPDPRWGRRVHAIVQVVPGISAPKADELDAFVRERLSAPKVPKTYEIGDAALRDELGKARRSQLGVLA